MKKFRLNRVAAALTLTAAASFAAVPAPAPASGGHNAHQPAKPTIVLVHGAFADSSGWSAVARRLTEAGYPVLAFSNPLRGPTADGEYLRQFLSTIGGDVVLVGHSYGGAVITNAATGNPHVKSLVYVAAYAPAAGESVEAANDLGGGHTDVTDHLIVRPYPGAPAGDADASIDPAWFHQLFAQDLPEKTATFMATSQRPGALSALVTPSGEPAWKRIPSWYLVAKQDRIIPPEAERAMAERAGSTTVVIDSSHVAMMSHPGVVTDLIRKAAG
ncbi:alpha/beta hydrolase [Nocardioides sp. CER19]|uniref:alpha/beta fold hydrolase n=1 Tax=Nocardioides sp. CER19 TaxID=3038538 RepID=UPI00244A96E5|nr:alpha/beta hydrolase [Nocardioides sp. CER19]MDH2413905.1 alpha/beta hydrolase [Nocardioides sp. CER19]